MAHIYPTATIKNCLKEKIFFILFFITAICASYGQNCSVNAGVLNVSICETEALVLEGNTPAPITGTVLWSQISGPAVIINTPTQTSTTVSGYSGGNTYVFRYAATCGDGTYTYQDKVVNVLPITVANAGADIASCPNSSGSLVINGNAPLNSGETGHWQIVGNNEAGLTINLPNSPTSTISLPTTYCGTTTLEWIIEGTEYAPGQRCRTTDSITVTNYGGVTPVTAGLNQTLSNCYTTTQSTTLTGSFGGCGLNGQNGQWQFVSGPNTPTISSPSTNSTDISNLIEGTYVFRWTVVGSCASGSSQVVITVPPATQDVTTLPGGTENIFFCDNTITQATLIAQTPLYAGETVEWTQISGDPGAVIVSPTNPTTLVTNLSDAGDPYRFRYTLTNASTGCVFSKDYVIQYNGPTRTIVANNGDNMFGTCNQTSFSIPLTTTGTGANTYRITSGPASSPLGPFPTALASVGSTLNISLTAPGTYIIEFVRAETGNLPVGCETGFDSIGVLVSNEPTPSNAGSDQSLACGVTSTILAGVTSGVDGNNYWSQLSGPNTAVIATPNDQNTSITGLIPGTYEFQYITKGGGITCGFSTDIIRVYVSGSFLSTPDAGPDQTVCDGSQVQLAANAPQPGEYGVWNQVSGPDTVTFSDVSDPSATVTGFNTTISAYVLQWTIGYTNPGATGCTAPISDSVTISTNGNSGVTIATAGPDTCYSSGTTVIPLNGNDTGLLENGLWTVTPSAGVVFADDADPDTTATVPGSGTYTFTWTITPAFSSCDPTSDSVNITIADTTIAANAGPDQSSCNTVFTMAATGSAGTTGTWILISGIGNVAISNVNDPGATFTFQNSGFYIFRWTVTAGICGQAFDDINITVGIPANPANAGPNQNICSGTSAVLAANDYDSFFEGGQWVVLAGAPNVPVFSDVTAPNATLSGLTAGTYTLRWVIYAKDVSLCPPTTDDVVIQVAPPANAGSDASYCDVTSVLLVAGLNTTGTWTQVSGPTSTITQSPPNSNIANATVIPGNSYVFTFTTDDYIFADSSVCPGTSDSVNVRIFSGPSIDPTAGPDQTRCISDVGGIVTLDGNTPPPDVTIAEWQFVYQPSGSVAIITTPTNPDTTVSNLTVPGLYILEWVFESNSCRTVSDIVRIVMYDAPSTANAGPDDSVACQQTYQTNAVPPVVGIGTWSFANPGDDPSGGDVVIDNPNNPVTTLSNITTLGTYVLTWTVNNGPFTSPSLCQPSSDTVVITFNANPPSQANAGQDQQLCNVTQATMAAIPVLSGIGTWTQASGPSTATIASPNSPSSVMFGLVQGTYEFVWTATTNNNDGCSSNDTVLVTIYALPSTANAGPDQSIPQFTPVVMAANSPTVGVGSWTQVSGPSTVSFLDVNSPVTSVTGTVSGTYILQWNITNGNCAASTNQVSIEIMSLADLELTKSVAPASGNNGDIVTFTIQVFNNGALGGSVDATGVAVRDMIPAGYTFVSGTASNGGVFNLGDHSLTWSNLSIPNGNIIALTFNATINTAGSHINTAQITASNQFDPDSTPNNSIATEDDQDDATILLQVADLSLQKSVTPTIASIGDNVVFTIAVTNSGPDIATGVTVFDQFPAGYTYISDNSGGAYNNATGIWTIGTINNGITATIQITAQVNNASALQYNNIARVATSNQSDPDSIPGNSLAEDDQDDAQVTLQVADLELNKAVSQPNVLVGDTVTFTLTVSNNGPGNATGVSVVDVLPNGYTLVPGSVSNAGIYQIANSTITWQNLTVANGDTLNLTFNAVVNATGNYINTAEIIDSDLSDPDSTPANGITTEDDYDSIAVTVGPDQVDLSLNKSVINNNLTPLVGSQISFEITVTNSSVFAATGVQVRDNIPSGYDYLLFSSTAGNYDETTGIWNIGTVNPNTTEILLLTVTVLATGNYENITEVTACTQPDIDSTPNNSITTEDDYDSVITTPVTTSADLSLTKTVNKPTPLVGESLTFTIVVTNNGPQTTGGVQVTDLLPDGYQYVLATTTAGVYSNATGVWSVGTLVNGASETLLINAKVLPAGSYINIAEITASSLPDIDSTPGNGNTSEDDYATAVTFPIPVSADLSVTKTIVGNNTTPLVGSQIIFTITVSNAGPQPVTSIRLTDLLPTGYTFVSYNATEGVYNEITGNWNINHEIPSGASETLQVTVSVNPTGNYQNIVEITASDVPDPDSTVNNGVTTEDDYASIITVPVAPTADLSLTKTIVNNTTTPLIGTPVTFTITVSNAGPQPATGVKVTDLLPTGYSFVSYNATEGIYNEATGIWDIAAPIGLGGSATLQVTALVNPAGNYLNTAEITNSNLPDPDSTPDNNNTAEDDYAGAITIPVPAAADLSITKTVNNPAPLVGSSVIFEIIVTNNGPQDATGVQVTDLLPNGYNFIVASPTAGVYNSATGLWTVGSLPTGDSETLLINASVLASGTYLNSAQVTASSIPDPDSTANNSVTTEDDYASAITVPIPTAADLSLTKTVNNLTPLVGSSVTFQITVTNSGPQNTAGVRVTDLLPTGYDFVLASSTSGIYNDATGVWIVGSVAGGTSEILLINAVVLPTGNYLNVAEVTSSTIPDPDSTPNNGVTTEDDYASVATTPIAPIADLSIAKTIVNNNITPLIGTQLIFNVVVSNAGPQAATGVQVLDLLPSGYTFVSYNATEGVYSEATGVWNINTAIASGSSQTLQITATVNATGNYLNTTEIIASNIPDPDSSVNNGVITEDDYAGIAAAPVTTRADLSLTKTVNNPTPLVGTSATFEIVVTNNGPQNATGVQVTDLLPSGYNFVLATTTSGVYNNGSGVWTVGSLNSGDSETMLINGIVQPAGDYLNVTEITASSQPDPDSTPGNAITTEDDYATAITTPVPTAADLSLTKTVNNPSPLVGASITFEVIVTNNGPQPATGVAVTDMLPSGYNYVLASTTSGIYNSTTGVWIIGTLANGASETMLVNAMVLPSGDYLNITEISASNIQDPDSTPGNGDITEDDYASAITVPVPVSADLSLTKTIVGNNTTPLIGTTVLFNIEVTNSGPQAATGVTVSDLLPSGYTFVSYNATEGVYNEVSGIWNIGGPLLSGTSKTFQITALVNATGDYENIAEISTSNLPDPDSTPGNNDSSEDDQDSTIVVPVIPTADLSLTKTVNNLTPFVGTQVTFEIIISNNGPESATGVQVTDLLPSGYTYVLASATAGTYNPVSGLWNIGILSNGTSETLLVHATVNATGDYENSAQVTASSLPDPDSIPANNIATEDDQAGATVTPVIQSADLSITKTVDNTNPVVGSEVTFEITITNDGPQVAGGIIVSDLLPSGYTYLFSSTTAGIYNLGTGVWNIGGIGDGDMETLLVVAKVNATGNYENIAEITSSSLPDPDSTPGNGIPAEDDQAMVLVIPIVESADLSVTKTVNNTSPFEGEQVTFEITVSNSGPQDATAVQLSDLLPSGYTYVLSSVTSGTYNPSTGLWNVQTVTNGNSETLLITATVLVTGNHKNIAQVTASSLPDPDSTPNNDDGDQSEDDEAAASVQIPGTDIAITKDVNVIEPVMYDNVTFTVTANNTGTLTATNIKVTDILPTGYEFVSALAASGNYDPGTGIWDIPSIAAGSLQTVNITVKIIDRNDYINTARLLSLDQIDTNAANNEDSAEVKPKCLKIYNEFSPNGDGDNDTFYIDCITQYPYNTLEVFNRWGDKVYSRKAYDNSWDGTSDGPEKVLPVGTYFYILDLGDGSDQQSGWLYLKR